MSGMHGLKPGTAVCLAQRLNHCPDPPSDVLGAYTQALNWVFGSSASSKHSVVNLSDGYSDRICYLAANTAIIYDKRLRRQVFLQVRSALD